MIARDDWKGPTKHFAKSEVVAGYVREVFKRLATPKFEDGAYRLNLQRYLLVEGAQGFFTGHSPRNWLTSAAAVLGWSKDQRDFLGRWMIGGSGSADYTRTAREVVHRIQIGVCEAIVTGKGGEYQESEALEELKAFVDERGGSGALARRRHDLLRTVEGVRCLGSKWPAIEQDDADASEEEEAPEAMNVEGSATKYFISISRKTGHRRLHLNGPCHVKPHHCNRVEFVERVALDQIDSICRDCKHRMREDQGAEDDQDTSSESGSTSDSSSEEGQLRRTVGMYVIVSDPRFSVSADQRAEVAKMDSDLQYVLQEASASLATQYQVARLHQSRRRFQAIADNREGARTAARDFGINPDTPAGRVEVAAIVAAWELAKEYASKEIELRAEAKVLGHKRILQVQERQAMLKAVTDAYGKMNESETPSAEYLATKAEECESNEPLASSLDRISSKKDSQVESLQTSIDPTGHVRVTKTMQKLEMPHHSEGYRRLMKVEAHAWLCMSARFKAKAWLQGLRLDDFTKFVEYILGDRVGNLKLPTASGQETQFNRPPWNIVLSYEYKLRVEAFKMILEGTATMAEALRAVREDPSLKEAYFTTPLALHTAGTPTKFRKGNSKGKDKQQGQEIPPPPAPHQNGCFGEHPASQHEAATAGQPVASRVVHVFADPAERFDWAPHLSNSMSQPEFAGNFFMWEAPEHFGRTADGIVPSSIWVWPLTGLPVLDADHRYVGPLPASCPHGGAAQGIDFTCTGQGFRYGGAYCKGGLVGLRHHSTAMPMSTRVLTKYLQQVAPGFQASAIAIFDDVRTGVHRDARNAHYPNMVVPLSDFEGGQIWLEQQGGDVWETTPEGQRPGVLLEVCKGPVSFDAWRSYHATRAWKGRRVVMVAYMTDKLGNVEASDLVHLKALGFELPLDLDASNGETSEALGTAEGPSTQDTAPPVPFRPEACGNRGNPIRVEWEGQEADMTDGFGLCSPSRWRPMDRGHRLGPAATAHAQSMYRMLTSFIAEHVPDPRRFCLSLLSGKIESSPFAGEKLEALRKQWAKVLGAEDSPDVLEIPDAQPFLLRALSLSAERLEDPDWEILTEGVDCFCTGVPLGLNCDIPHLPQVYERKCQWRKLDESELDFDRENYKSAELSSAGLLEKFRAEEKLGRMKPTTLGALREEYSDDMIRVASMGAILKPDGSVRPLHDGTHGVNVNNQIRLVNQLAVPGPAEMSFSVRQSGAMQETPLAATADVSAAHRLVLHRKRYELDYGARLVGLSEARGAWVCNWVDEARKARFVVSVRKFAEFLGRLGFVSRVVYWIKPHLAPLYAWSAAASKSHVAKMPDTVILTLLYLEATLKDINFKVTPGQQQEEKGHLFHTDAKCDDGYVVLGGWDSSQDLSVASWFSIVVKPADAPYLFDSAGKSQWASASAELLATLAALWFFGHLKESSSQRRLPVAIAGATDNQSNEKLLKKQSTTKWPLMLINMQLSHLLRKACLRLSLTWKPRDENKLADALTNQDFSSFSSEHRLDVSFSELPLELLNQLWLSKSDFDASRKALQSASNFLPHVPKRKREGTPW
ncbi:unnamed protein product [Symbiodinium sp. CCMP2592]|nr:unnamed protein product [Symbiodinium sp. CCMP2592]